jgi:hypothetical protein
MLVLAIQFSKTKEHKQPHPKGYGKLEFSQMLWHEGHHRATKAHTPHITKTCRPRRPLKTEDRNRFESKLKQSNKLCTPRSIV